MIISLCVIFLHLFLIECLHFRSDYKYDHNADGWLKLHRVPANWHEARLMCQLEGALLASPVNGLVAAMKATMVAEQVSSGMHTGIHATLAKGVYTSLEGVPLSRIAVSWAPGEPDNLDDDEDCLMLQLAGNMADVNCSKILPYMCYKQKTKLVTNECGTIDYEYQLSNVTGSCYKFHRVARSWSRAFMTCVAEGGHLAIINSDAEADYLKALYAKYPDNILTTRYKTVASIGFHDWGEHLTWLTVHGQSLKEAGYEKWGPGQPGDQGDKQNCGALTKTGLLDDIFCSALCSFICEKSPDSLEADIQEATKKR